MDSLLLLLLFSSAILVGHMIINSLVETAKPQEENEIYDVSRGRCSRRII